MTVLQLLERGGEAERGAFCRYEGLEKLQSLARNMDPVFYEHGGCNIVVKSSGSGRGNLKLYFHQRVLYIELVPNVLYLRKNPVIDLRGVKKKLKLPSVVS